MSLNEKLGQGRTSSRKVSINSAPDENLLRRLLNDLSDATTASQCELSWQSGEDVYNLALSHSRLSARAEWELYLVQGMQATLLWSHATNDINAVQRSIAHAHQQARPTKSQTRLTAAHPNEIGPSDRRAININSNLSGKLRKLFIGAQEEIITGSQLPPVAQPHQFSENQVPPKPTTAFIDITSGREIMQNVFMGNFGIFSYPTFLFFLEREYFQSIENKTPVSLVIFRAMAAGNKGMNTFPSPVLQSALQEITKRIKHTQRKTDILAQYEADKFVMLLPETDNAGAKSFVNRVQSALSKAPLLSTLGIGSIKFSFGITTLGQHCETLHMFLTYADKALERGHILGKDIFCDLDVIAENSFNENQIKSIDLTAARELVARLISAGIFTYPAFLAFLEQEYHRAARKEQDLLILILKIRLYEETYENASNMLPAPAFYEVIRRIGSLLNKRDIFAHYGQGNFVIMRSNATAAQMDSFGKRLIGAVTSEEWLTPECPVSALRTHTQICIARAHPTAVNLFCFVPAN